MSTYSVILCQREKLDPYIPLIMSKWLRSLRHGNDYFRLVASESFFKSYHRYIEGLLEREDVVVRLAVLTDDPDVVLGFSVSRGTILEYVHVHKDQRRLGIARSLVPKHIDTITHLTRTGATIWGSKMPGVKFDPFV